jgi:hypothetical protein
MHACMYVCIYKTLQTVSVFLDRACFVVDKCVFLVNS